MSKKNILFKGILGLILGLLLISCSENTNFSSEVKVALREVGHQLLISNYDSTSLVLPIEELSSDKFQISFEKELIINSDQVVSFIENSFEKLTLPKHYIVEVLPCHNDEVVYSYAVKKVKKSSIIACGTRVLPRGCYIITVQFTHKKTDITSIIILIIALLSALFFFYFSRKQTKQHIETETLIDDNHTVIGVFKFYPDQNKLVKEAIDVQLSKKECELLSIFIASPNQIITREELTKRVWEDNGVFVGRSLDTYISKLRKILKDDATIKITNVHGVGYKLEILK